MNRGARRVIAVLAVVAAVTQGPAASAQTAVNPQAAALKDFSDRVQGYMALREKASREVPALVEHAPADAVTQRRDALAAAIRKARSHAQEGDVFTPPVAAQFRGIIRHDLQSRDFQDAVAAVEEVAYRSVWVNMPWPTDAPRPTIPARILTQLQPLPEGLEYRLLNRHLVLLDIDAQLVVDLVRNVLPSSIRPRVKQ